MEIVLKKDYVIKAGTIFDLIPESVCSNSYYIAVVGVSREGMLEINVDAETVKDCPDLFEVVK